MKNSLRAMVIHLANTKPDLRPHLLPLITQEKVAVEPGFRYTQVEITSTQRVSFLVRVPTSISDDDVEDLVYNRGIDDIFRHVKDRAHEITTPELEVSYTGWGRIVDQDGKLAPDVHKVYDIKSGRWVSVR